MGQARVKRPLRSCQRHHPAPAAVRPSQPELGPHAPLGCPSPTGMRTESSGPAQGRGLRSLVSCHSKVTARAEPPKHTPTSGDGTQGEPCECRVWGTGSSRERPAQAGADPAPETLAPGSRTGCPALPRSSPTLKTGPGSLWEAAPGWDGETGLPRAGPEAAAWRPGVPRLLGGGRVRTPTSLSRPRGPASAPHRLGARVQQVPRFRQRPWSLGLGAGLEGLLPRLQVGMRAAV